MNKLNFSDLLVGIALSLLILSGSMLAQNASVSITPASVDTKVNAGASYTKTFTVVNGSNDRLRVQGSFEDVWINEKNERLSGKAGTLPRSASLWIQFTPSEIIVEPRTSATLKAIITVPQNATGSFYTAPAFNISAVAATPVGLALTNTAKASIGVRFRTLMMLTTEKGAEYNVELMGADLTPPSATNELKLDLDLRNRGNAHAQVRGAFAILDTSGKLAGRGTIDEKKVLPGQRRSVAGSWPGELAPGEYTAIVTLSYNRVGAQPTSLVREIAFKVR